MARPKGAKDGQPRKTYNTGNLQAPFALQSPEPRTHTMAGKVSAGADAFYDRQKAAGLSAGRLLEGLFRIAAKNPDWWLEMRELIDDHMQPPNKK